MAKISLSDIVSGFNLLKVNENFSKIQEALNNSVLYRDNPTGEDNTLKNDIDANGHRLYNLPAPTLDSQAARLQDVKNAVAGIGGFVANLISFAPQNGLTSTNVQSAVEEANNNIKAAVLTLKQSGVVGDGVADDTAALAAVIATAYAGNRQVVWNGAVCRITGNIPYFHLVKHVGPGRTVRGTDVFNVSGSGTANLYVALTGSAGNDGLTAAFPKATLQQAFDAIANYGPMITQDVYIRLAANTYPMSTPAVHLIPSQQYIKVMGPDVGGSPNVPTCIFDGAGGAIYSHAIFAQQIGVRIKVSDIKFINFNNGGGNSGDTSRGGFVTSDGAMGWGKNLHVIGASWFGCIATSAQQLLVEGGIYDGCRVGVASEHSRCSVGWNGTSTTNRTLIKNCVEQGIQWSNGSQGHIDYTDFTSNGIGVSLEGGSRCDAVDNDFKRNSYAVECKGGGYFGNNPATPSRFNVGTADANTVDITSNAYGADYNGLLKASASEARVDQYRGNFTATGTTADQLYYSSSAIPAGFFKNATQTIRIRVYGTLTTATLPAIMKTKIAGVSLADVVMPTNVVTGQAFKFEIELFSNGTGNHMAYQCLAEGTSSTERMSLGTVNFAFVNGSTIDLSCAVQNAADSVIIRRVEILAAG